MRNTIRRLERVFTGRLEVCPICQEPGELITQDVETELLDKPLRRVQEVYIAHPAWTAWPRPVHPACFLGTV